ncbi:hypothetical protein, partial [Bacillus safensis]|uniref:hypothetical protein n=2 Tax=Bacillus safensis TaxID=561879 RepID=UPI001C704AC6
FNRITHSCPHRKNTSMFYFGSQRSVFKLEGVFYLSHLMGSVPGVEAFLFGLWIKGVENGKRLLTCE